VSAPIPINDPDDPRLEPYRDIRERDLVGRGGAFIAEGIVVLDVLLRSARHRPLSVLIAERRIASLLPRLERLPADIPVYGAGDDVIARIAGFPVHRGVLAHGKSAPLPSAEEALAALPAEALVLVLIGIANHDNVGGIFRNAAAFGADLVLLDAASCDPLYRKAIRVSVGGTLIVPFARISPDTDVPGLLDRHRLKAIALSPQGRSRLEDLTTEARAALILGSEGGGLPAPILERCETVRIPMEPGFDSLNVATASGIALHHLRRLGRS
jgi:tRNA G18 (ribose-2'-O)-methylase SpoU